MESGERGALAGSPYDSQLRSGGSWLTEFVAKTNRKRRRRLVTGVFDKIIAVIVALGVWQLLSGRVVRVLFISSPSLVFKDLASLLTTGQFYSDLGITLVEALVGLALGVIAGCIAGTVLGIQERFSAAVQPIMVGVDCMPRIAIAPLFIVWLGFGVTPKILLAGFATFFVIFFNVVGGIHDVDPAYVDNLKIMGYSRREIIRYVLVPSAFAWMVTGLKAAISLSLLAAVVGEYLGSTAGIGHEMSIAISFLNTTRMFSLLFVCAVLGSGLFLLVGVLERFLLRWR